MESFLYIMGLEHDTQSLSGFTMKETDIRETGFDENILFDIFNWV